MVGIIARECGQIGLSPRHDSEIAASALWVRGVSRGPASAETESSAVAMAPAPYQLPPLAACQRGRYTRSASRFQFAKLTYRHAARLKQQRPIKYGNS